MYKILSLAIAIATLFSACHEDDTPSNIQFGGNASGNSSSSGSGSNTSGSNSGISTNGTSRNPLLNRIEMPQLLGDANELLVAHYTAPVRAGEDSLLNYALAYDRAEFHSRWIAFRFEPVNRSKSVARKNGTIEPQYPRDPKIPANVAIADDASFIGSLHDHGHLCASADRLYSREANDQTFYMSNMSPQLRQFNQNYWTALESLVQDLGRDASFADTLYVVKGGTIMSASNIIQHINVRLADGTTGKMAQPRYYYMALLKVKNGAYSAIGFLLEHKNYGTNGTKALMKSHIVSIDELERQTGLNFFHNLPDATEAAVESSAVPSAWTF